MKISAARVFRATAATTVGTVFAGATLTGVSVTDQSPITRCPPGVLQRAPDSQDVIRTVPSDPYECYQRSARPKRTSVAVTLRINHGRSYQRERLNASSAEQPLQSMNRWMAELRSARLSPVLPADSVMTPGWLSMRMGMPSFI